MSTNLINLKPESFDLFGLATFTFILAVGIWALLSKKRLPQWVAIMLMIIGVLGLVVDGTIVFTSFIAK